MESRISDHRMSPTDRYTPFPEVRAEARRPETRDLPKVAKHDGLEKLQETDAMLRAAIEALSPDVQEVQQTLARQQDDASSASHRQLGFRLIVAAVILILLILALDLVFA